MASSNSYNFGENTEIDDLIKESFERIGIIGNEIEGLKIQSAIMSANLELTSWQGKVPLTWTRKRFMSNLYINQQNYLLPKTITRLLNVIAIQPQRLNTGGTAVSSNGGIAANCFDPLITAGCVQTAANGSIAYNYPQGVTPSIQYVGITPLIQSNYTLVIEYSFDNVNWITVYNEPLKTYYPNQIAWFVTEKSVNARYWRIRETGGATLGMQQIYFSTPTNSGTGDRTLSELSYTEWMQIPTKNNVGFPSSYFFNAQIQPILTLWPILGPSQETGQFTAFLYDAYQYTQDIVYLFEQFDIPQRFYDALVAGISARLAQKFAPDRYQLCKADSIAAFQLAALTEAQELPLRLQPDFLSYGG
jgi:hypothetical protein